MAILLMVEIGWGIAHGVWMQGIQDPSQFHKRRDARAGRPLRVQCTRPCVHHPRGQPFLRAIRKPADDMAHALVRNARQNCHGLPM